jgi:DNA-binding LytR/AlgR family response regulator
LTVKNPYTQGRKTCLRNREVNQPYTGKALIAEDEPVLRESLEQQLSLVWPALAVVARARNGREAFDQFDEHHPDVCFLDVHMPGVTGIEAARHIGHRAHLVFVTAYDQYAVQAFAQGVLDYIVKPVDATRLAQTAARLQERLRTAMAAVNTEVLLQELAVTLERRNTAAPLRWIRASVGQTVTLIPVQDVDFSSTSCAPRRNTPWSCGMKPAARYAKRLSGRR